MYVMPNYRTGTGSGALRPWDHSRAPENLINQDPLFQVWPLRELLKRAPRYIEPMGWAPNLPDFCRPLKP